METCGHKLVEAAQKRRSFFLNYLFEDRHLDRSEELFNTV